MTLRIAVVGAGAWGVNHLRVVAGDPGCALAAVVDPDPGVRKRLEHVACFGDIAPVLRDPAIDAVIIASPARTHAEYGSAALRAGKHVLVEKPLAMSVADACAVEEAGRASGAIGMVGHLMVYHPAVARLAQVLRSGALGKLHYLHSMRVNLGRIRHDESALWSFGPHDLSMIDFLLDAMPIDVIARGQQVLQVGLEDVVFLTLRYPDNIMVHVHLSWLSPRKERRLTLVCSQKMAEFDDVAADKLRIYDKGYDRPPEFTEYAQYLTLRDGDVHIPQLSMQEPLQLQLRHFVACIAAKREPMTNLMSGVRITRILEAAQRSLSSDGALVRIS